MTNISKIAVFPLLVCLMSIAIPAGAVSLDSSWYISRYNTAGTSYKVMAPSAGHFCYLRRVYINETDTGGEYAMCNLYRGSVAWVLEAKLGKSSDADVQCGAYCFNY